MNALDHHRYCPLYVSTLVGCSDKTCCILHTISWYVPERKLDNVGVVFVGWDGILFRKAEDNQVGRRSPN